MYYAPFVVYTGTVVPEIGFKANYWEGDLFQTEQEALTVGEAFATKLGPDFDCVGAFEVC